MKKFIQSLKNMKTSTKFVAAAVVAILAFTAACFVILATTGFNIPGELIVAYYGFWTVEIVSLAAIKNSKTKHNSEMEEIEKDEETNIVNTIKEEVFERLQNIQNKGEREE